MISLLNVFNISGVKLRRIGQLTVENKQTENYFHFRKKRTASLKQSFLYLFGYGYYIIPPIPPPPIEGTAGVSSFLSAITHSVVRIIAAIEAAFSNAILVTLVGSITPAA